MAFRGVTLLLVATLLASTQGMVTNPTVLKWANVLSPADKAFDKDGSNFDILTKLVGIAGLGEQLTSMGDYTLFAPNDRAFVVTARFITPFRGPVTDEEGAYNALVAAVTSGIMVDGKLVKGKALVSAILTYHAISVPVASRFVLGQASILRTLSGTTLISTGTGELADQAKDVPNPSVIKADLKVGNNVTVHVINAVLLPVSIPLDASVFFCQ